MKKVFVFAAVLTICTMVLNEAHSQTMVMNTPSILKNEFTVASATAADNVSKPADITINARALKNFSKSYKKIKNENWSIISDGYTARFFVDSVKNTVYFDTKGRWSGLVKNFSEFQLPVEIRTLVKRTYFDYAINCGIEIETLASNGIPTYIVYVEDKKSIKWLRIYDGEMEVYNEFFK